MRVKNLLWGLISPVLYPIAERIEGRNITPKVRSFLKQYHLPFADRKRQAHRALYNILAFAGRHVPYYRRLFQDISFDVEKILQDPQYLADIPVLSKDIILEQGDELLSDRRENMQACKTGGSTGQSVIIHYDREAMDWSACMTHAARHLIGATLRRHHVQFAALFDSQDKPQTKREILKQELKHLTFNRKVVLVSAFTDDDLASIWDSLKTRQPYLVHSHPSTMYRMAIMVQNRYGQDNAFQIFEPSGELLTEQQRQVIEHTLQCTVINRYGLAEFGVVAYQTDQTSQRTNNMRVFENFIWPESLDGELLMTGLTNYCMPLIRYRSGDRGQIEETEQGLYLTEMTGRIHDVISINGEQYMTHFIQDLLDRIGGVENFQIKGRPDNYTLCIVPTKNARKDVILTYMKEYFPQKMDIQFIHADQLVYKGRRSKFRYIIDE